MQKTKRRVKERVPMEECKRRALEALGTKRKGLREIGWGHAGDTNKRCIYDNGTIDALEFLQRVREWRGGDISDDARAALTANDVRHLRFRPMSPSEAKAWGVDHGVVETEEGRGYPVTVVIL